MPANNYITVIEKTMLALESFRGERNVRLADLASRTRLVKSSVFRILFTLERLGYVEKGPQGTYSISSRLRGLLGDAQPAPDLTTQAGPFMAALLHKFQETVNLGVLDHDEVLYIRVMESPQAFRLAAHAGMRGPLHSTALGKCLLSTLPKARVESILKRRPLEAHTPHTIRGRTEFHRELRRTRQQGYGVDDEEDSLGIRCLAAPILDTAGNVMAGLSISAPAVRLQPDRDLEVASALKEASAQISRLRGYTIGSRQLRREAR